MRSDPVLPLTSAYRDRASKGGTKSTSTRPVDPRVILHGSMLFSQPNALTSRTFPPHDSKGIFSEVVLRASCEGRSCGRDSEQRDTDNITINANTTEKNMTDSVTESES